jgi:hypothetical protein
MYQQRCTIASGERVCDDWVELGDRDRAVRLAAGRPANAFVRAIETTSGDDDNSAGQK